MVSEKIQLLGKGLYKTIPDEITIQAIPTASELDYVSAEDFEATMLDKIFPKAIEEKDCNWRELLEIDFHWICRCLRITNYGPYHNVNTIFCEKCGTAHRGDYIIDLRAVPCIPLPDGFVNKIKLGKELFLDYDKDIVIHLPSIQDVMNAEKDKAFTEEQSELARICYMITSFGGESSLTPFEIKSAIQKKMSSADYIILKDEISKLTNYGLRAGGRCVCPVCGDNQASFISFVNDRYFRVSVDALRKWRADRG